MEASCSDEMMNPSEPVNEGASTSQQGRGEKRMHDEVDDGDDDEDERPYAIENVKEVNIRKFRTKGTNYTLRFNNIMADAEIKDVHERLHDVFQHILDDTVGNVPSRDQVRMLIHSTQLEYPIAFPFKPAQALTTERILSEIQRVVQSNQHFRLNDTVNVNVIHVSMPSGGKGSKRTEMNLKKHLEKKKSVVRIQNTDDLCMAHALVVAKAKVDEDPQYKSIVDHRKPMQTRMAQELHANADVPLGPCGIEEAKQFQAYLTEYQINIVSKEYNNKIIYSGPDKDKKIYLYMHNNHYDVITKMPGFFARAYYCHECKKAYNNVETHLCPNSCKCCGARPICPELSWMPCNDCGRMFKSQQCYDQHKEPRGKARSVCQGWVKCPQCKKAVQRYCAAPDKHGCEKKKCGICGKFVKLEDHFCFIQPETKKRKRKRSEEEEEEEEDLGGFFGTQCRVGNNEDDDEEPDEEVLTDLVLRSRVSPRKRNARTELVCRSERSGRGMDFPRRYDAKGLLRMVIHGRSYWVHRDGS